MRKLALLLPVSILAVVLTAESTQAPPPAVSSAGSPAGTVTSVVNTPLITHGRDVLHGIARDPKTGDMYVGVSNFLTHFTPFVGFTYSNDDSLRRITSGGVVTRLTSFPYPNGITINPRDGKLYIAVGAIHCYRTAGGTPFSTHCPGTNGLVVVDPATGDHNDFAGAAPGFANGVGPDARFTAVAGVVIIPEDGSMYVTD